MIKNKISIVLPVFNEEGNLPILYKNLSSVVKKISASYEIIFINDGSSDSSLTILETIVRKDKRVKYINFSRNFGHQVALSAGLESASGDAIITMDSDLQDPPELIPELVAQWEKGYDIVYAHRKDRKDKLFKKYTAILYYKILHRFSDVHMPRNVGDFRLISKRVLQIINEMPEKARYLRGMVAWVGFNHTFVDFERPNRVHGKTNYTFDKMVRLAMDGIINFSLMPLKVGFLLGVISIVTGMLFLIYMITDTIIHKTNYPLFKFLVVVNLVFLGLIFILLWLVGEYVGRIYEEKKGRPLYIVEKKVNFSSSKRKG